MTTFSATESLPASPRPRPVVLGMAILACILLIGASGAMKYQIDRAQTALTTPAGGASDETETLRKLRQSLGYGGFVGIAQGYATSHDANALSNMKEHLDAAHGLFARLPETLAPDLRNDLQSILSTFDAAYTEATKATSDPISFTTSDMTPLYAALPVLDSRVETLSPDANAAAQQKLQFWSMLLTVFSWISLILATVFAASLYLLRATRDSSAVQALTQSVKNMVKGDMNTSIWGMEREDSVGELARAMDLARYHFSQLPDLSLMSDQGPVRLRFEGNTRSLFEAIVSNISNDADQIRGQTTQLADSLTRQQDAMNLISSRVEAILHNIEKRGMDGDKIVHKAVQELLGSADSLKHAQEHASDQLNRIVPYLQERAQGMAEITQLTGRQVSQALQSLTQSDRGLRQNAEQGQDVIQKLSATATDLGDRLFGAMNLLQASGKVLNESTEKTQSRLNEAVDKITQFLAHPSVAVATTAGEPSTAVAERLEIAIEALESLQRGLEQRIGDQTQATQAQIDLLITQSSGLLTQSAASAQTLSTAADHLREEREKLGQSLQAVTNQITVSTPTISGADVPSVVLASEDLRNEIRGSFTSTIQHLEQIGARLIQQANAAFDRTGLAVEENRRYMTRAVTTAEQNQQQLIEIATHAERTTEALTTLGQVTETLTREPAYVNNVLAEIRAGFETSIHRLEQTTSQILGKSSGVPAQISDQLAAIQQTLESVARDPIFARNLIVEIKSGFRTTTHSLEQIVGQVAQQLADTAGRSSATTDQIRQQIQEILSRVERAAEKMAALSQATDMLANKPAFIEPLLAEIRTGFGVTAQNLDHIGNRIQTRTDEQLGRAVQATEQSRQQLADIASHTERATEKLAVIGRATESLSREPSYVSTLLVEIKSGFETLLQNLEQTAAQTQQQTQQQTGEIVSAVTVASDQADRRTLTLGMQSDRIMERVEKCAQTIEAQSREPQFVPALLGEMRGCFGATIRTLEQIGQNLQQQTREAGSKTDATNEATQQQIGVLMTHTERMTHALTTLGQATDILTRDPAFAKTLVTEIRGGFMTASQNSEQIQKQIQQIVQESQGRSGIAAEQMRQQLCDMGAQIERVAKKLTAIEQTTAAMAREPGFFENLLVDIKTDFELTSRNIERMREQFTNMTLTGATQGSAALPDNLRDQWYQITAQIEATRTGIEQLMATQVERLENRIAGLDGKPSSSVTDEATRRQMEQQSRALAELVATISVLDSHMKDIRSQMTELRIGKLA